MKILILGSTGMLGHKVKKELAELNPICPVRDDFNALAPNLSKYELGRGDYVINCIGAIPQKITNHIEMVEVNSIFPRWLAENTEAKVIHITTDCVFNGKIGYYAETSPHTAADIYGKSKSLGEVDAKNVMNLRCSIIGDDPRSRASLYEWVRNQPEGAIIKGYLDHTWNGITTLALARIILGIIRSNRFMPGVAHIVPIGQMSKNRLIRLILEHTNRKDVSLQATITGQRVNRTLMTRFPETNKELWKAAGYGSVPTIETLLGEVHD
jgi:dTDP-4-dehydrorhamnose reductase